MASCAAGHIEEHVHLNKKVYKRWRHTLMKYIKNLRDLIFFLDVFFKG